MSTIEELQDEAEREDDDTLDRTWRVFKLETDNDDVTLWQELGVRVAEYKYGALSAAQIGAEFGTGEYLLIKADESYYIKSVRVIGETVYRQADSEEG